MDTRREQYDFLLEDSAHARVLCGSVLCKTADHDPAAGVCRRARRRWPWDIGSHGQEASRFTLVIEAMKMEHTITAPYAGTVETIHFAQGTRVPEGSELLALKRNAASDSTAG